MVILGSGNVGIGTSNPATKLHVSGGTLMVDNAWSFASKDSGGTPRSLLFMAGNATAGNFGDNAYFGVQTANSSVIVTNALARLTVDSSGNVGIGTTSPSNLFHVAGAGRFGTSSSYYTVLDTNRLDAWNNGSGSALYLNYNGGNTLINTIGGNVGIGTSAPGYKLDVNGEVNATGLRINGNPIATGGSSQWNNGTGSIYYTGNVGIGTTSPAWPLHTRATSTGVGFSTSDFVLGTTGTVFNIAYGASTGNTYTSLQTTTTGGIVAGNTVLQKDGGNVGIGTISPGAALDVAGGASNSVVSRMTGTGGYTVLRINNPGNSDGYFGTTGANGGNLLSGGLNYATVVTSGNATALQLGTNSVARQTIDSSGNVGIGTTSPSNMLHVAGAGRFGTSASYYTVLDINRLDAWNNGSPSALSLNYNGGNTLINTISGNVGIGTPSPAQKLDILGGNINVSSSGGVGGNITITGTINAKYQDVAEWVPSSEQLSAGTVVVLDSTTANQVTSSTISYDTRVAGVVSEQPGLALGEKSEGKVLVATTGRVRVKVDATKAPIHIGDLLVTSDIPGVAMKSEPVNLGGVQIHRPGTLIGKAQEPLEKGSGSILVLLSLQ